MERNRRAVASLLGREVKIEGHTDLAADGRKFSGNSQRRRKRFLLFHGTFLLNLDLAPLGSLLPPPSRQPAYRQNRSHQDFLMNLKLPAAEVKAALREVWSATTPLATVPRSGIERLVCEKYSTRDWTTKF
jgi:lipoate-protein ligase A